MAHTARTTFIAITIAALVWSLAQPAGSESDAAQPAPSGPTEVINATPEEAELLEWAVGRFEAAGLPLPAFTIAFHDTEEGCDDNLGLYRSGTRHIDFCNRGQHRTTPANTLLHELGHAWSIVFLEEADRQAFAKHRSLDQWYDADGPWWLMGQEQAAEIVTWGLMDDPFQSIWVHTERCEDLAEAFEVLTGTAPLHGHTDYCKT